MIEKSGRLWNADWRVRQSVDRTLSFLEGSLVLPLRKPRIARLFLPRFEFVLQFDETLGGFGIVGEIVSFIGVGLKVIQLKARTVEVGGRRPPSIDRQFGFQCHLPGRRSVKVGGEWVRQFVSDVEDQLVPAADDCPHRVVHRDFMKRVREVDFVELGIASGERFQKRTAVERDWLSLHVLGGPRSFG